MELKKSPEANLENKKNVYFLVGLLLALGVVLIAFEWTQYEGDVGELGDLNFVMEEEEMIPITQQQPPPPPPPPQATIIEIVEDDEEIEKELEIEDSESDENDVIEFVEIEEFVAAPEIFHIVEEQPEFPGGEAKLMQWLSSNTKFPPIAKDAGISGVVYIQFVVREDGKVDPNDITVLRSVHPALDNEAIRVVKSMPAWKPGRQRGKAVSVYYKLPFRFSLK
jgi:periplasmic protein TonB